MIYLGSSTKLAAITDGTSNTFLFGEHAHGIIAAKDRPLYHLWSSGFWGDTQFDTLYPINAHKKFRTRSRAGGSGSRSMPRRASTPGGPTSRSATARSGSSRRRSAPGRPTSRTAATRSGSNTGPTASTRIGNAKPSVYQALATRNGGEVLSGDGY